MGTFRVYVDVRVFDTTELREFAKTRAMAAGQTEVEFAEGEHTGDDFELNIPHWLGWAFDSGTPEKCGFQIDQSGAEEN